MNVVGFRTVPALRCRLGEQPCVFQAAETSFPDGIIFRGTLRQLCTAACEERRAADWCPAAPGGARGCRCYTTRGSLGAGAARCWVWGPHQMDADLCVPAWCPTKGHRWAVKPWPRCRQSREVPLRPAHGGREARLAFPPGLTAPASPFPTGAGRPRCPPASRGPARGHSLPRAGSVRRPLPSPPLPPRAGWAAGPCGERGRDSPGLGPPPRGGDTHHPGAGPEPGAASRSAEPPAGRGALPRPQPRPRPRAASAALPHLPACSRTRASGQAAAAPPPRAPASLPALRRAAEGWRRRQGESSSAAAWARRHPRALSRAGGAELRALGPAPLPAPRSPAQHGRARLSSLVPNRSNARAEIQPARAGHKHEGRREGVGPGQKGGPARKWSFKKLLLALSLVKAGPDTQSLPPGLCTVAIYWGARAPPDRPRSPLRRRAGGGRQEPRPGSGSAGCSAVATSPWARLATGDLQEGLALSFEAP